MSRSCFVARDLCSRGYAAFEIDFNGKFCRPVIVGRDYVRGRTKVGIKRALKSLGISVVPRSELEIPSDVLTKG